MTESIDAPLAGVRILITRAADDAAPLRGRLEALGSQVLELPAIEIAPPEDTAALDAALRTLEAFDWIAFTSRRAVRAVFSRLGALGLPAALPLRVAAVGPATEAALTERGIRVDCRPAEGTAGALGDALQRLGVAGQTVLLPIGDLALPDLRVSLEATGARVHTVVAYRTVQPLHVRMESMQALRRGGVDAIALTSPSAARNLAAMLGTDMPLLQHVRLVCIGPATAAAVRDLGLEPAVEAGEHSLEGLVAAIVEAFSGDRG